MSGGPKSIASRLRSTWGAHLICRLLAGLLVILLVPQALGAGPRYVTGPPFYTGQQGVPVGWRQANLQYFTDPGSLSAAVNHQAADALVAAAANVWNLPVASITIGQGGQLAEHVNGQNTFMGANGIVFPTDVMSTNAAAIPIAVIYDTDGSITETLLGAGASDPGECRQDGVTESVDAFDPAGYILHAVIVLNGRCTGAAPQLQLQMRYQLMRAFGRVLGLAWSQTNDNVFTGSPTPTYQQELNWPIMHPIDIICGSYTYQCLANPFQLRPDDIASMVTVYPVTQSIQGKQPSLNNAASLFGAIRFPTGEGMAGVNVLVQPSDGSAGWSQISGVTGTTFRRAGVATFMTAGSDALSSMGRTDQYWAGAYSIGYIPVAPNATLAAMRVVLEPVNALYARQYSLGPYAPGNVTPSGTATTLPGQVVAGVGGPSEVDSTIADAAAACGNGADGTTYVPVEAPATGWWNGLLCAYGHAAYVSANVKPGRTFTVEATALDAQGYATTTKAMPVIGVFAPTDAPPNAAPSLALAPTAFQAWALGTTTVSAATGQVTSVKIAIADQRGDGRPDFTYQARMFYADSITPAKIATVGATVTITGSGFRTGNAVSINGVQVSVVSWSANVLVVTAPAMSVVGASDKSAVDVVVSDRTTGATSTMAAALTYDSNAGLPNAMRVVSLPTAPVYAGDSTAVPFTVQLVAADGLTPVAGDTVVFSGLGGAQFGSCLAASCTVVTDSHGMASETVTTTATGTVTITATDGALQQSGSFYANIRAGSILITSAPSGSVNVGVQAQNQFQVQVLDTNGRPIPYTTVTLSVAAGGATFSACSTSVCTLTVDNNGSAWTWVTPTTAGTVTLQAAVGSVTQTTSFTGASNVDVMQVVTAPAASTWPNTSPGEFTIALLHPDGSADYLQPVTFTAPPGLIFPVCGSNVCVIQTNYSGVIAMTAPYSPTAGTYTLQASFGSVTQSVTFTVKYHSLELNLVSKPADNAAPYVSSTVPFAVRVTLDGTTPLPGVAVQLTGTAGEMTYDQCSDNACTLTTDSNGVVSTTVTPLVAGAISLNAVFGSVALATSYTVVGVPASLRIVEQPGAAGLPVGVTQVLVAQLIGTDGVTPLDWQRLYFTVLSGPFAFTDCSAGTCMADTCCGGLSGISGQAYGPGPVTLQVAYGAVTKLIQFTAVAPPDVLKLISAPASGGYAGQAEGVPFAAQALFHDGVTPVSGRLVTVSVTNGQAGLAACAGASSCVLTADANGMISTVVTPSSAGSITVTANDGGVMVSASFNAVPRPDSMTVTVAPAANTYVGTSTVFTVKVIEGDGVTPRAGASVVFTASAGTVQFGACAASCTVTTGADGSASVGVTPLVAGTITLQALDGAQAQAVSFAAITRPDVLSVVSAPANGAWVGLVAANVFSVRLMQGDGVTPDAGKTIALSANGATLGACGATVCSVVTDASGMASTPVTPTAAGIVTLNASGNGLTSTVTFTAALRPDVMSMVSVPANGTLLGSVAAATFSVRLLQGDGTTPDAGRTITLSATGATLGACGAASCALVTDASGLVATTVTPTIAGTIALQAVAGTLVQMASFTAIRPDVLSVISAPANGAWVGVTAANVFSLRLTQGDGVTPDAGKTITLSANGATLGLCGATSCTAVTDANGIVSTPVTPTAAGLVTLTGTGNGLTSTVTFSAATRPDVLSVISAPANGAWVGLAAANVFSVRLMQGDGVTPDAGKTISLSANGATLGVCGATTCPAVTDASGFASTSVTPTLAGVVTLTASGSGQTATVTFTAAVRPDVLSVVSVPANGTVLGSVAGTSFSVRLMQGDGTKPDAGKNVTLSATGATLGACGTASCTLVTDASGLVATTVTPTIAGTVALQAVNGTLVQAASFMAARPDVLSVVNAPANGSWVGVTAANVFSVRLMQGDGVTPDAGKTISLSANGATLGVCGAPVCSVVTDASGIVSTPVTPTAAGAVTLTANSNGLTATVTFTAALRPDVLSVVSVPANGTLVGSVAATTFSVRLLQGDGTTPDVGKAITITATGATLGACGTASCTLVTDASGLVTTTVTPTIAGTVALQAVNGTLVQAASFMAARPDVLSVVSAPANGSWVGVMAANVFSARLMQGDGVTPDAGKTVTLSANGATLGLCGAVSCTAVTDANGIVSTPVTPGAAGNVALTAQALGLTVTVTFSAANRPDLLQIAGAPADGALVGDVATAPLIVQVLAGDGITAVVGRSVTVSVTNSSATLTACGASACTLTTDTRGMVSTGVIPQAAGSIALTATEGSGGAAAQTVTFKAKSKPDLFSLVNTPGSSVLSGVTAVSPFAVKVTLADGVTPVAGIAVAFAFAPGVGTVRFGTCSSTACVVATGADGTASTPVIGGVAGNVTLSATATLPGGMLTLTASLTVLPNRYAVTALTLPIYIAEGSRVPVTLRASAIENGSPSAGQSVHWTQGTGFVLAATDTLTDASGETSVQTMLGPLAGGAQVSATACAWTNVCATFAATGVAAADLQTVITSGGQQAATGGAAFAPMTVQVLDGSGHAVMGAAVNVYQTVSALDVACPAHGRCPAAAVLASKVIVMDSAADGTVTIAPLTLSGVATSTEIAISVGTQGFATSVLTSHP